METNTFPAALCFIALIVWLCVLYNILTRVDFDTAQRILWVIVVIFVPFFGVIFYWMIAPGKVVTPNQSSKVYFDETIASSDIGGRNVTGSDVAGTPWADDPGHTNS